MKAILLALAMFSLAGTAVASPCGEKIAQLQSRYDAAPILAGSGPVGGLPADAETTGAKLHHQPAPANDADADVSALSPQSIRDADFKNAMEEAKAADDSGDAGNCEAAVGRAERALSR